MKDKKEKMIEVPIEFGVYGVWAWRIDNFESYYNAVLRNEKFPTSTGVKNIAMHGGQYENINDFIDRSESNAQWLLEALNEGAHIITIGTGEKWQVYEIANTEKVFNIMENITESLNKHRSDD